jgi:hypothetical protein
MFASFPSPACGERAFFEIIKESFFRNITDENRKVKFGGKIRFTPRAGKKESREPQYLDWRKGCINGKILAKIKKINNIIMLNKIIRIISDLVGRSDLVSCCPGKKAGAEDKKGREKPSKPPFPCFRKETRWQRADRAEAAEARI